MKVLAWNCRGIGSPSAVRALKEVIRSSSPLVVGLIETKCGNRRCEIVRLKLGFDCCFVVPARGRSGGLALFWNNSTDVSVVSFSGFHIDFTLRHRGSVHVTLFYGNPRSSLRHKSWDLIRRLRGLINLPWCVIGDFNEIFNFSESTSSNLSRRGLMENFRQALLDCELMDLGFKGSKFTYSNKRKGYDEIQCRLDRAVGDVLWVEKYPNSVIQHLISHRSDHCPLLLSMDGVIRAKGKPFRFEAMWMRDSSFADTVNKNWNPNGNMSDKLIHLTQQLKVWNRKSFGHVGNHLRKLKKDLAEVRLCRRTQFTSEKEKSISNEIDEWLIREETMWSQRSRISWLSEGDNNTKYFHLKANARRRVNTISSLIDSEGRSVSSLDDIERVAVSYFRGLFTSTSHMPDSEIIDSLQCIPRLVSVDHSRVLMNPYTEYEIKVALFQLYPYKAPGLDGYPAGFFQRFWNVIKVDFIEACYSILNEGIVPTGINETLIVLIPKQSSATRMEDYRPISLTSVVSKTVAKVIVNRLQQILPEIISPAQSAFVKGRLITDNFLIAHEIAHFIKNTRYGSKSYGSLKLDMSKAYDRVEWRYLKMLLLRFGFEERWVNMIMNYVSSVRYAICINGEITAAFEPERGLRQGDPLSPYLFILCSEWLSYSLSKFQAQRCIEGIKVSRAAPHVTHLMFADDCLLAFKVGDNTGNVLANILREYEHISGQVVNYNKSELVLSPNVAATVRNILQASLSVRIVSHHVKYLGLPLTLKRKLTLNFSEMIDKFYKRTEGWKAKNLSSGGKEILIKSVLQALPQYSMNCFQLPEDTIKKMHSSLRRYWWSCSSSKSPIHWVKAQTLCQDKDMGGMGFKDLKCINLSFLAKQAWRLYTQPDLLISKIYSAKYCHSSDMLYCSAGYRPSFCWRSIVKGFEILRIGSNQDHNGHINWTANPSGQFDLSSAYKLLMRTYGRVSSQEVGCSDYSHRKKFWNSYWKLPVPRKVKIFGWRGYHASLPTGISLHKRGMFNNVSCGKCGYKIETYAHVFLHCWIARATWEHLGLSDLCLLPESASFADIIHYCWSHFPSMKRQLILVTLWMLWFSRNKLKHEENDYSLNELVYKAINLSRSFAQNDSKYLSSMRFLYFSDFEWKAPPAGFVKINCDAAMRERVGGGIGIIARDSYGKTLAVRAIKRADIHNIAACEGIGLLESFILADKLKADKVIFESDCAEIVKCFNICPDSRFAQENWFKTGMQFLHRRLDWKIVLIRREANIVADLLAKRVMDDNWCWTRLDCCPRLSFLSSYRKSSLSCL
ncbi:unnamed protein product [Rhodiola kirilowii]